MFFVVTVNTEVLPIGSIGRVIQVIAVFVVDGQKMSGLFIKFSSALGTNQAMDLKGSFSIVTPWRIGFL